MHIADTLIINRNVYPNVNRKNITVRAASHLADRSLAKTKIPCNNSRDG